MGSPAWELQHIILGNPRWTSSDETRICKVHGWTCPLGRSSCQPQDILKGDFFSTCQTRSFGDELRDVPIVQASQPNQIKVWAFHPRLQKAPASASLCSAWRGPRALWIQLLKDPTVSLLQCFHPVLSHNIQWQFNATHTTLHGKCFSLQPGELPSCLAMLFHSHPSPLPCSIPLGIIDFWRAFLLSMPYRSLHRTFVKKSWDASELLAQLRRGFEDCSSASRLLNPTSDPLILWGILLNMHKQGYSWHV